MANPYRAYDIRGIYPDDVNVELVQKVIPVLIKEFIGNDEIVIGHDPRIGSVELYEEAIKEIEEAGAKPIKVGIMTTPMLTFLVNDLEADGGIIITASHNPKEYNGIKMISREKGQISGEEVYKKLKN